MKAFYSLLFAIFTLQYCLAFAPEDYLPEPQEQRARKLFLEIKCPVCAGQVIESSETEVAFALRKLVRSQIIEGKSDEEIRSYLVGKYGDEILNSAPFNKKTALLWFLPLVFAVIGTIVGVRILCKKRV